MAAAPADAAEVAVQRLRELREQAGQRQAAARAAVQRLRARNREQSQRLAGQAGARPQSAWPAGQPLSGELLLYETSELDDPGVPTPPPRPAARPDHARGTDDDWAQESWLH